MSVKGWKFPIEVDKKTGKIKTIENNENIKQSIEIILKTEILERKILSNFGFDMKSFMFGIVNPNYLSAFKKSIRAAITNWEEHVINLEVDVRYVPDSVSKVEAQINYITDLEPSRDTIKSTFNTNDH